MRRFIRPAAAALALSMIALMAGCSKTGGSETTAGTTDTEIPAYPSYSSEMSGTLDVTETSLTSDTSASSASSASSSAEDSMSFSVDGFMQGVRDAGVKIYGEYSDFLADYDKLVSKDSQTVNEYTKGFAVRVDGHDNTMKMISDIGDGSDGNDDFLNHLTGLGYLMAGDINTGSFTIAVLFYQLDDAKVVTDWFDSSVKDFESGMSEYRNSTELTLKSGRKDTEDVISYLYKYTINDDAAQQQGYPLGSGTYGGIYISGDRCMFITLIDTDNGHRGSAIMESLCSSMGIPSPAEI